MQYAADRTTYNATYVHAATHFLRKKTKFFMVPLFSGCGNALSGQSATYSYTKHQPSISYVRSNSILYECSSTKLSTSHKYNREHILRFFMISLVSDIFKT